MRSGPLTSSNLISTINELVLKGWAIACGCSKHFFLEASKVFRESPVFFPAPQTQQIYAWNSEVLPKEAVHFFYVILNCHNPLYCFSDPSGKSSSTAVMSAEDLVKCGAPHTRANLGHLKVFAWTSSPKEWILLFLNAKTVLGERYSSVSSPQL